MIYTTIRILEHVDFKKKERVCTAAHAIAYGLNKRGVRTMNLANLDGCQIPFVFTQAHVGK